MTFLELTRIDDVKVRVNMDHVSEYISTVRGALITYMDNQALEVKETAEYIDGKIHEIEQWRKNARNRT